MIANRFNTTETAPKLTANLTRDLMDPGLSVLDLCDHHDLNLNQLDELTRSPEFEDLRAFIARVSAARRELIELDAEPRALAALLETTRLPQEDQKSTETVRKAATRLLPRASGGVTRATPSSCLPRPAGEVSRSDGGGLPHKRPSANQTRTSPNAHAEPSPPPHLRGQKEMCHDEVVTEGVFPKIHSSPRLLDSIPLLPPTLPFPPAPPPYTARIPGLIASAGLPAPSALTP